MKNTKTITRFKGLNNVSDPLRLDTGWMSRADNIDIDDTGAFARREGYAAALSAACAGAYATIDTLRMYAVMSGALVRVNADMSTTPLRTGLSDAPMYWGEVNNQVFYTNGTDSGIIIPGDTVRDWAWEVPGMPRLTATAGSLPAGVYQVACSYSFADGRETGAGAAALIELDGTQGLSIEEIPQIAGLNTEVYIAPANSTVFQFAFYAHGSAATWNGHADELGVELLPQFLDPLPQGAIYPTFWGGRVYAAQYLPHEDQTVVWFSEPLAYHLFNLNSGFFMVPGRVTMLAPHDKGLLVGTNTRIFGYPGDALEQLADYGVVPGYVWAVDDDPGRTVFFWSTRGLCSAFPFSNLTQRQVSLDCGTQAGAAIIRSNGQKKYVVSLKEGGEVFNPRV